jgi:hypothetical protein
MNHTKSYESQSIRDIASLPFILIKFPPRPGRGPGILPIQWTASDYSLTYCTTGLYHTVEILMRDTMRRWGSMLLLCVWLTVAAFILVDAAEFAIEAPTTCLVGATHTPGPAGWVYSAKSVSMDGLEQLGGNNGSAPACLETVLGVGVDSGIQLWNTTACAGPVHVLLFPSCTSPGVAIEENETATSRVQTPAWNVTLGENGDWGAQALQLTLSGSGSLAGSGCRPLVGGARQRVTWRVVPVSRRGDSCQVDFNFSRSAACSCDTARNCPHALQTGGCMCSPCLNRTAHGSPAVRANKNRLAEVYNAKNTGQLEVVYGDVGGTLMGVQVSDTNSRISVTVEYTLHGYTEYVL